MEHVNRLSRCARRWAAVIAMSSPVMGMVAVQAHGQMASAPAAPVLGTGVLPSPQVERLLPPSVYFNGQSAPLQLRNAAAFRSASGAIAWVSLVDTSGYSTGVRERYQFYVVSESPLMFGDVKLPAGAYGAGFLQDGSAVVLDLGAHEIARTPLKTDEAMRRPRPLQMQADGSGYRLYLGKQYVTLSFVPGSGAATGAHQE